MATVVAATHVVFRRHAVAQAPLVAMTMTMTMTTELEVEVEVLEMPCRCVVPRTQWYPTRVRLQWRLRRVGREQ